MLEDEAMNGKGNDSALAARVAAVHDGHPCLSPSASSSLAFVIVHYLGPVEYNFEG